MVGILVPSVGVISWYYWNLPDLRTRMAILCYHLGRLGSPLHFDLDVGAFNQFSSSNLFGHYLDSARGLQSSKFLSPYASIWHD